MLDIFSGVEVRVQVNDVSFLNRGDVLQCLRVGDQLLRCRCVFGASTGVAVEDEDPVGVRLGNRLNGDVIALVVRRAFAVESRIRSERS